MLRLVVKETCRSLLAEFGIPTPLVALTLERGDQTVASEQLDRVVAVKWFEDGRVLLADAAVTAYRPPDDGDASPTLALWLRPVLPAGSIDRDTDAVTVLTLVAQSFGFPVVCHANRPPATLYAGPWDGLPPRPSFPGGRRPPSVTCGSFRASDSSCEMVYSVDVVRYGSWLKSPE